MCLLVKPSSTAERIWISRLNSDVLFCFFSNQTKLQMAKGEKKKIGNEIHEREGERAKNTKSIRSWIHVNFFRSHKPSREIKYGTCKINCVFDADTLDRALWNTFHFHILIGCCWFAIQVKHTDIIIRNQYGEKTARLDDHSSESQHFL